MLAAAKAAAPPETRVVAVTVLTSLDATDLAATGHQRFAGRTGGASRAARADAGRRRHRLFRRGGRAARATWPDGFFVVPGVRPAGTDVGDQKRVVTPRQALDDGASVLVIGRPITGAPNPAPSDPRHRCRAVAEPRTRI